MSSRGSLARIDALNIGLMVGSAWLAYLYPFQLFLLVYAVLGPAHYLTEISWLHDRKYFAKGKRDHLWLLGAAALITAGAYRLIPGFTPAWLGMLMIVTFVAGLAFATVASWSWRLPLLGLSALVGFVFAQDLAFSSIVVGFLPTIIHVSLFTGCFILVGALKNRSSSGILALVVFVGVGLFFFLYELHRPAAAASDYVRTVYGHIRGDLSYGDGFVGLNVQMLRTFGLHEFVQGAQPMAEFVRDVNAFLYTSPRGLSVMSFIAFAYTYHYLNWFSKTSIIRWHEVPRSRLAVIVVIWIASVALYAYDYATGLKWLFLLSLAHVMLEFPLNHLTFQNIGKDLWRLVTGQPAQARAGVRTEVDP